MTRGQWEEEKPTSHWDTSQYWTFRASNSLSVYVKRKQTYGDDPTEWVIQVDGIQTFIRSSSIDLASVQRIGLGMLQGILISGLVYVEEALKPAKDPAPPPT